MPSDNNTICANDEAIVLIPVPADLALGDEGTVGGPEPRLYVYELHVGLVEGADHEGAQPDGPPRATKKRNARSGG